MSTSQYKCKCCGLLFAARTADRARGWARYCSKSCKAKKQEQRTGQHRAFVQREGINTDGAFDYMASGSDEDMSYGAFK